MNYRDRYMKYVRVKDDIFDKLDETLVLASSPEQYELRKHGELVDYAFCKDCRKASTIEELCDVFVIVNNENEMEVIRNFNFAKNSCIYDVLYGAIWTSRGLKFVAKLNDEGEMELL